MSGIEIENVVTVKKFQTLGGDRGWHDLVKGAAAVAVVTELAQHGGRDVRAAASDVVHREERVFRRRSGGDRESDGEGEN